LRVRALQTSSINLKYESEIVNFGHPLRSIPHSIRETLQSAKQDDSMVVSRPSWVTYIHPLLLLLLVVVVVVVMPWWHAVIVLRRRPMPSWLAPPGDRTTNHNNDDDHVTVYTGLPITQRGSAHHQTGHLFGINSLSQW